MEQAHPLHLPPALDHAAQRVRLATRQAAEQAVQRLGLAAQASQQVVQRDLLLAAQQALARGLTRFNQDFDTALDTELARQTGLLVPTAAPPSNPPGGMGGWESLRLVDDDEVDLQILAGRCALEINHACGWALGEFDACMARLLGQMTPDHARNPLRAEVVAEAMVKAIHGVTEQAALRQALVAELGRVLAPGLRQAYQDSVTAWRASGVEPVALAPRPAPAQAGVRTGSDAAGPASPMAQASAPPAPPAATGTPSPSTDRGQPPVAAYPAGQTLGDVNADMVALLRQLQRGAAAWPAAPGTPGTMGAAASHCPDAPAPNLITQHRAALRQATHTPLDHLLIDLVAGLFDQILADPQVPPQFARQIARLQMPVLRAALGDNGFFSSHAHPVRRLVNRIASLAAAVNPAESATSQALLAQVQAVVQAVVGGDFEHRAVYEQQLQALDSFAADQTASALQALDLAPELLARKAHELCCQAHFAQHLNQALAPLPVPAYLGEFLAQVWGPLIVRITLKEGPDSPLPQRLRQTGRELVMSVQPKGAPAQRQLFLQRLPQLMKDLQLGLDHARCPATLRQDFFAHLLPAHAEAMKQPALSTLAYNLLSRQVEAAFAEPVQPDPAPASLADASFTPAEAQALGLVDELAVAWQDQVDIDLDLAPELGAVDIAIDGLPPPDAPLPSRGPALAEHLQPGLAYQMQLQGQWQQVTLVHVSAGGSFFIFSHGHQGRGAVSLTRRMLLRLCETGRLRALETADLIARATARARQQLAALHRPQAH